MCGSQSAVSTDGIVQGFGAVLSNSREVVPVSAPRQINLGNVRGVNRALAVAAHLRIQNRALVRDFLEYRELGLPGVAVPLQAGAAATEALADLLEALAAENAHAARSVLMLFVNEAVDSGAVTL